MSIKADVVIFSILKKNIRDECREYEKKTGKTMKKDNFLEVYGCAGEAPGKTAKDE